MSNVQLQPHEQRVVEEMNQLKSNVKKLTAFIAGSIFPILDRLQQVLLKKQLIYMTEYLGVLELRVFIFHNPGFELPKTKGEVIIGDFGTENIDVFDIKLKAIDMVDTIEKLGKCPRRKATAITDVEKAQMIAVKSYFNEK